MPSLTKENIMGLLQADLTPFVDFVLGVSHPTDLDAARYKWMFEQIDRVNHTDPVFQGLLTSLVAKGVITQTTKDRIDNS